MKSAIIAAIVLSISADSTNRWREDLNFLQKEIPRVHANAFHTIKPEAYASMFDNLRARLPEMTENQIAVEVMRVAAAIGDGHTVFEINNPNAGFTVLPVRLYFFSDGLFVRATTPAYGSLVGKRVTRIGSLSTDEAMRRVAEVVPRDNEMTIKSNLPLALTIPEVLNGLGITSSDTEVTLTVEDGGAPREVRVKPIEFSAIDSSQWVDARPKGNAPLYLQDATYTFRNPWTKYYWFQHLPDRKTLYIKYNAVANADDEPLSDFFARAYDFADRNGVERVILDLRQNGGGNNQLNLPIVHGIIKRDAINRRGRLFVIIGRETFSAAQNAANLLEKHTNVIFAGEPTGGRPNHFGDSARITLPNSKWSVRASTLWWQDMDPRDRRPFIAPEIAVEVSSADYAANRDPVLDAIFKVSDVRRISDRIDAALKSGGLEQARKEFRAYMADPVHKYARVESEVNSFGYRLMLREKRIDDAIAVFKLNVEMHPDSWNTHDSLAEAYAAKGEKELAIASYERAAKLNPGRAAIREAIEDLKKKP